jgi:hypothetical protein
MHASTAFSIPPASAPRAAVPPSSFGPAVPPPNQYHHTTVPLSFCCQAGDQNVCMLFLHIHTYSCIPSIDHPIFLPPPFLPLPKSTVFLFPPGIRRNSHTGDGSAINSPRSSVCDGSACFHDLDDPISLPFLVSSSRMMSLS